MALSQHLASWRLSRFFRNALPQVVIRGMQGVKTRILSRGLPRHRVYEQPGEQRLASASMSIVVPIHDAPLVTKRCLASLERNALDSEIVLVDDGSKIVETNRVIREFSDRNGWKVIRNAKASGHSAACLTGSQLATRPYLCLLNSDTVVTPWCWRAIENAFETDPTIAVAGPCTSTSGNVQALDIAASCQFYWNDSQICAFAAQLMSSPPQPVIVDLPWVSGFAFFIRRDLWNQLGGFDRNLPDYGNEIELCKRVTHLGLRMVWVRSSYIHHLGGQSYRQVMTRTEIHSRKVAGTEYARR